MELHKILILINTALLFAIMLGFVYWIKLRADLQEAKARLLLLMATKNIVYNSKDLIENLKKMPKGSVIFFDERDMLEKEAKARVKGYAKALAKDDKALTEIAKKYLKGKK